MTDKQLIIDDVDVSGCEWIRQVGLDSEYICTCNSANKISGYCKYNPNCHHKQLKRKEQECEELKDKLNCCFCNPHIELNDTDKQRKCLEVTECFRRQLDQVEAENKELKGLLKVRIEDLCDSCGAGSMMPIPCKVYKKTLTEIKKIMKKHCRKCQKDKFYHFKLCCTCKYTDIIQKISEVEDDI